MVSNAGISYEAALAGPEGSRAVAKRFGVSKSKVNYDRAKLREAQFLATQGGAMMGDIDGLVSAEHNESGSSYTLTSEVAWGYEDFRRFIRSRGQDPDAVDFEWGVTSNPTGGYWNKLMRVRPKKGHIELDWDGILGSLDGWEPEVPVASNGHSCVLNLADLQLGKMLGTGLGTESTVELVRRSVAVFAAQVRAEEPDEVVVVDNGDIVENLFNYPNQTGMIDLPLTRQVELAIRLQVEIIKMLAPLTPRLVVGAVPSNHGQVRTGQQKAAGYVDDDWGLFVNRELEDRLDIPNVRFARPDVDEETLVIVTSGTRLAFNHGHRAGGGQAGVLKWIQGQENGRQPGWDADIWVMAHYHHLYMFTHGNGRWCIGVSSPEPGSAWFRYAKGQESGRGLTRFSTSGGKWWNLEMV